MVNNQFAYSTPTNLEIPIANVADRASGYNMKGYVVDGNDVLAVYEIAKKAADNARGGGGPSLIEAKTMRMKGHAGHDPADYVPKSLLEEWAQKDPLKRFESYLSENNLWEDTDKKQIEERIDNEISGAVKFADESPYPDPKDLKTGVYSG